MRLFYCFFYCLLLCINTIAASECVRFSNDVNEDVEYEYKDEVVGGGYSSIYMPGCGLMMVANVESIMPTLVKNTKQRPHDMLPVMVLSEMQKKQITIDELKNDNAQPKK